MSYWVYRDWDLVLNSVCFDLATLLHKIKRGEPKRFPTYNKLHDRVPFLILDDAGANLNKARTQFERSMDWFKGGFDTLGTRRGVLCANMVSPNSLTSQLTNKYNHEIYVHSRGKAKYDKVHQQQDYRSW
jgi:hypothetical protein